MYCKQSDKIILIDPRGYENEGLRSPYYDLAKFSHSFLGKYDLIINNKCSYNFDYELNFSLSFEKKYRLNKDLFFNLCNDLKMDYSLVRLIESSLFLSMISLHKEDLTRCFNLCCRSYEIFDKYKKELKK